MVLTKTLKRLRRAEKLEERAEIGKHAQKSEDRKFKQRLVYMSRKTNKPGIVWRSSRESEPRSGVGCSAAWGIEVMAIYGREGLPRNGRVVGEK